MLLPIPPLSVPMKRQEPVLIQTEEILMRKGTVVDSGAEISPEEVRLTVRASGPGGQNAKKVATAVQFRFNARNSRSM